MVTHAGDVRIHSGLTRMQTLPRALVASPPHAVLPLGVQMQLRRAALGKDIDAIDRITDSLVVAGLCRPRGDCAWMTRAEIGRTLAGLQGR